MSRGARRAWTIPDILCAKHLVFRWGQRELDAQAFCCALEVYERHSHPNLIKHPRAHTLASAARIRQRHQAGEDYWNQILSIIRLAYPLKATNARDRAYSALAPIATSKHQPLQGSWRLLNYSDHPVKAFVRMARILDDADPTTPFVSMSLAGNTARPGVERGELAGLPTWVPDWSDPQEMHIHQLNEPDSTFSAWSGYAAVAVSPSPIVMYDDFLCFRAAAIDTVDQISSYQPPRRPADRLNVGAMNSLFFSEWWDWVHQRRMNRYKANDEER